MAEGVKTVRVTGTVTEAIPDPGDSTVMLPAYVPAASAEGFTDTVAVTGVVPELGATLSQVPFAVDAVKVTCAAAPVATTASGCVTVVPPAGAVKDSDAGDAVN
jgi:hypothetical protein